MSNSFIELETIETSTPIHVTVRTVSPTKHINTLSLFISLAPTSHMIVLSFLYDCKHDCTWLYTWLSVNIAFINCCVGSILTQLLQWLWQFMPIQSMSIVTQNLTPVTLDWVQWHSKFLTEHSTLLTKLCRHTVPDGSTKPGSDTTSLVTLGHDTRPASD